jgi:trk system potassium uptake protein TrkH
MVVARYLGHILLAMAALTVVPAAVAASSGHGEVALRYAAVVSGLGLLGAAGVRIRCTRQIQANEALVVSALAFVLSGLVMAYPIAAYGIAPLDAVFESISGVTTTGLSTLATLEDRPRSFLFARAWLQWVGGLGVVVLALAVLIPSGVAARRLGFDDREAADYVGGTRAHARRILTVYLCLTAIAVLALFLSGMDGFDALVHALTAVSTGGFSTSDASLAGFGAASRTVVSIVCLAGALSFATFYRLSVPAALRDLRPWMLLGFAAIGTGLTALLGGATLGDAPWRQAAWMAVSAQTTAGFSTWPTEQLAPAAKLVLLIGMLVGGDIGSTAGGFKILRVLILLELVGARILRASMPARSTLPLRLGGTRIEPREIEAIAGLAVVYAIALVGSWMAFVAFGHAPLDALFEVGSALGTVGLSAGPTGPGLEPALKGVLCLDMLMGRLELFAILVLVFPGTWIGRRRSSR